MTEPIDLLAKRRAQAEIVRPIYDVLKAELGVEAAQRKLGEAVRRSAIAEGQARAELEPEGPNVERFARLIPLWQAGGALEIEFVAESEKELSFNVTRCRYAEMYREMGLGEIGHLLSCNRDGSFCEGYDPRIKLTRTQTIMQGASHCDFRFRVEK